MSISDRIKREINNKALKTGAMGTKSVNVQLKLTEEEKEEFLNLELDDHYWWEFTEYNGNEELSITYREEI